MTDRKKKAAAILSFFTPSLIVIAVVFILFRVLFGLCFVPTTSMEPTLPKKSLSFIVRTPLLVHSLERGNIVVFQPSPENSDVVVDDSPTLVKRIVGLAGDTVEIKDGTTYVNGQEYQEPWLAETPEKLNFGPYQVEDGKIFVLGDNRNHSVDSRYWIDPYVDVSSVVGKIVYVIK